MSTPIKSTLVYGLILLAVSCKSIQNNFLADRWLGDDGTEIMIFHPDSTLQWIFRDTLLSDTFQVRYRLDETVSPAHLDLYDFNSGIMKGKVLAGILERHSNDSILLDFEPAESLDEADSVRPKSFNLEQRRFFIRKK